MITPTQHHHNTKKHVMCFTSEASSVIAVAMLTQFGSFCKFTLRLCCCIVLCVRLSSVIFKLLKLPDLPVCCLIETPIWFCGCTDALLLLFGGSCRVGSLMWGSISVLSLLVGGGSVIFCTLLLPLGVPASRSISSPLHKLSTQPTVAIDNTIPQCYSVLVRATLGGPLPSRCKDLCWLRPFFPVSSLFFPAA